MSYEGPVYTHISGRRGILAQRDHGPCNVCGQVIEAGQTYNRYVYVNDETPGLTVEKVHNIGCEIAVEVIGGYAPPAVAPLVDEALDVRPERGTR